MDNISTSSIKVDRRGVVYTALIHLALGIALCQDAIFTLGRRVIGFSGAEVWVFLWGHHWTAHSVLKEGRFPYQTDLLDFPLGGVLWVKDPLSHLFVLPVQTLVGVPGAFTTWELLVFVLNGVGFFLLARLLGVSRWVACLSALPFAFCPHVLGEVYNANTEAFAGFWCALWLWAMLRAARCPRPGTIIAAALLLLGMFITNQYFALAMAVASGPVLLMGIWSWRHQVRWHRQILSVTAVVVLGIVLYLPFAWAIMTSLASPLRLNEITFDVPYHLPYVSDLKHMLMPMARLSGSPLHPFQDLVYPGLVVAALMLLCPLLGPKNLWRWLWPVLGLFFLVMSLGPALMIDGHLVLWDDGTPVHMPWYYLVKNKPLIGKMSLSHRIMVPAGLFLSLGLAWSVEGLRRRLMARFHPGAWVVGQLQRRAIYSIPLLLVAAAMVEIIYYPPYDIPLTSVSTKNPAHTKLLSKLSMPGAVMNLPFLLESNDLRQYMWWQALHERPIGTSLKHAKPPSVAYHIPWLERFAWAQRENKNMPKADPTVRQQLRRNGYRFVVVHDHYMQDRFVERSSDEFVHILRKTLGPGLVLADQSVVYALDERTEKILWKEAPRILGASQVRGAAIDVFRLENMKPIPVNKSDIY